MSFDRSAPKLSVLIVLTLCLLLAVGYPFLGRALSAAGVTAMFCDTVTEIPTSECNALVALYNATGGGSWTVNTDWLITSTPCSWFGVECDVTPYPYPGSVPYPAEHFVSGLNLANNNLTGTLPPEIGDFPKLMTLSLGTNHLTGAIPGTVGSLTELRTLYLSKNALSGEVPASFPDLTELQVGIDSSPWTGLGLDYNLLKASDPTLSAFLDGKDSTWRFTQTLPPANLQAVDVGHEYVLLSWTPILYTADGGYYEIHTATLPGGPFTLNGHTADKSANGFNAEGLNAMTQYYLKVRTYTPSHANPNALWSEFSEPIAVTTQAYQNMLPLIMR